MEDSTIKYKGNPQILKSQNCYLINSVTGHTNFFLFQENTQML